MMIVLLLLGVWWDYPLRITDCGFVFLILLFKKACTLFLFFSKFSFLFYLTLSLSILSLPNSLPSSFSPLFYSFPLYFFLSSIPFFPSSFYPTPHVIYFKMYFKIKEVPTLKPYLRSTHFRTNTKEVVRRKSAIDNRINSEGGPESIVINDKRASNWCGSMPGKNWH